MSSIDDLKNEAASLGIKHNANIGEDKLKEKIEEYYVSQETSGAELAETVSKVEEKRTSNGGTPSRPVDARTAKRIARQKASSKTRVVIIIDNDQRTNSHTTTCSVNCSNEFFDLGTAILPLGEKIEVAQGHLNVLKEVFIPIHHRDPKTGLAVTKTRPRYSISYEDVQT